MAQSGEFIAVTCAITYILCSAQDRLYDPLNRLTSRAVSDGRAYTYTWSARGQLLVEWTQGYPVRTFTYDGAGRLVEATVFTLTTRFTYNGLGERVIVEVVGQGVTTVTLDLAAGGRILAEETLTGTTLYLYGLDCLGEQRNDEWLYYLPDAGGLVRQGVDAEGDVTSAWLFDPSGVVLEGPQGPVSHLVCSGVYDWSTGLIYKNGRYFDPLLGVWLALMPLVVVQSWRGRKGKRRAWPWMVALALFVVGVSGTLTACGACKGPSIDPPSACAEVTSSGQPLGDNAIFVGPTAGNQLPEYPEAMTWDAGEKQIVEAALTDAINNKFGGPTGFGSLDAALADFGASTDNPIVVVRRPEEPGCPNAVAAACKPYVYVYNPFFDIVPTLQEAEMDHEMAHYWDDAHNRELNTEMREWTNWGDTATDYGTTNTREDLAEAVRVYFWPQYDTEENPPRLWTDDMGAGLTMANDPQYGGRGRDGLMLDPATKQPSATGTVQVQDRYDWLQVQFTGAWMDRTP